MPIIQNTHLYMRYYRVFLKLSDEDSMRKNTHLQLTRDVYFTECKYMCMY